MSPLKCNPLKRWPEPMTVKSARTGVCAFGGKTKAGVGSVPTLDEIRWKKVTSHRHHHVIHDRLRRQAKLQREPRELASG